jgi:hypothetical protein
MWFLGLRVVHILLAATWLGAAALRTLVVVPAMGNASANGSVVATAIVKNGLVTVMAMLAGLATLTGIVMYWHFTGGFNPEISRSHAGMAFGLGGAAGLIAAIVDGSITGRSAKKMVASIEKAAAAPDASARAALLKEAAAQRATVASSGMLAFALMVVALVCMAVGHYV